MKIERTARTASNGAPKNQQAKSKRDGSHFQETSHCDVRAQPTRFLHFRLLLQPVMTTITKNLPPFVRNLGVSIVGEVRV
jgi:hypothetical protein